jgi:hypothetical protein
MSTQIRKNLTTQLNKLVGYVTAIDPAIDKINDGGDPLTPDEIQDLRRNRALMEGIFPRIAERERQWENLLAGLEDQALVAEQAVYDAYQAGGKHFAEYVEDA